MKSKARHKKDYILGNLKPGRKIWWAVDDNAPHLLRCSAFREDFLDLILMDSKVHTVPASSFIRAIRDSSLKLGTTDPKKVQLPYLTLVEDKNG